MVGRDHCHHPGEQISKANDKPSPTSYQCEPPLELSSNRQNTFRAMAFFLKTVPSSCPYHKYRIQDFFDLALASSFTLRADTNGLVYARIVAVLL